jgi:hypothetical protein
MMRSLPAAASAHKESRRGDDHAWLAVDRYKDNDDIRDMNRATIPTSMLAAFVVACGNGAPRWLSSSEPPAAAEAANIPAGTPLADVLESIEAELDTALAGPLTEDAVTHLTRAEAMTDRLPESRLPFGWLAAQHYRLEARLWQIQALADRALAEIRVGARREDVLPDVVALREQIAALRSALAQGGAPQPEPIERILQRLDSVTVRRPATPQQP